MEKIKALLEFVAADEIVADIGCGSGDLLKIGLKSGKIRKGYAIDNKEGPLQSARDNIKAQNVTFILSDGLKNVFAPDITCCVIAGIGGIACNKILAAALAKFQKIGKIIVCPHNNVARVRKFYTEKGFKIFQEKIIQEKNIFYEIIAFMPGKMVLTTQDMIFGPLLRREKSPLFILKWQNELKRIQEILKKGVKNEDLFKLSQMILEVLHD